MKELAQKVGEWIRLTFYRSARRDGLVERYEIFEKKMIETFAGRDDRLVYRPVSLVATNESFASESSRRMKMDDERRGGGEETIDGGERRQKRPSEELRDGRRRGSHSNVYPTSIEHDNAERREERALREVPRFD